MVLCTILLATWHRINMPVNQWHKMNEHSKTLYALLTSLKALDYKSLGFVSNIPTGIDLVVLLLKDALVECWFHFPKVWEFFKEATCLKNLQMIKRHKMKSFLWNEFILEACVLPPCQASDTGTNATLTATATSTWDYCSLSAFIDYLYRIHSFLL